MLILLLIADGVRYQYGTVDTVIETSVVLSCNCLGRNSCLHEFYLQWAQLNEGFNIFWLYTEGIELEGMPGYELFEITGFKIDGENWPLQPQAMPYPVPE